MPALTLSALLLGSTILPAAAAVRPTGNRCNGMVLTADGAGQTWALDAGPLVLADLGSPAATVSGRVRCTIRRGTTHTAAFLAEAVSGETPAVLVLAPATVSFAAGVTDETDLCTEVDLSDGTVRYWDDLNAVWSADPGVLCFLDVGRIPPL